MQFLLVIEQSKAVDEPDQAKIMIAVQVRNKDMGYLAPADLIIDHLYLCAFAAIDQVVIAIIGHHLAGGMPVKCRYSRVIAENSDSEHEIVSDFDVCNVSKDGNLSGFAAL